MSKATTLPTEENCLVGDAYGVLGRDGYTMLQKQSVHGSITVAIS